MANSSISEQIITSGAVGLVSVYKYNNNIYEIKDPSARAAIDEINSKLTGGTNISGSVSLELSDEYAMSTGTEEDLIPVSGDSYEEAISKLHKAIIDDEEVHAAALTDLDDRLSALESGSINIVGTSLELSDEYAPANASGSYLELMSGDTYEEAISKLHKTLIDTQELEALSFADVYDRIDELDSSSNSVQQVQSDWNQSNTGSVDYIKNKPNLSQYVTNVKTINNQTLIGTGNITISTGDVNVIETIKVNNTAQTVSDKTVNISLKTVNSNSIVGSGDITINGGDTNVIESISVNNTAQTISNKNVNIPLKTVNSNSIVGTGDITINEGDANVIESISVNNHEQTVTSKNVNIELKTVNGNSILGSGNISISGTGGGEANVIEAIIFNGVTAPIETKVASISTHLDKIPSVTTGPSGSITIDPYKVYNFGSISSSLTVAFDTSKEVSGYVAEYSFRFDALTGCSITLPNGCLYNGGSAPTYVSGHTYEININDNLVVVGEFY